MTDEMHLIPRFEMAPLLALRDELSSVATLAHAAAWKTKAQSIILSLEGYLESIPRLRAELDQREELSKADHKKRSIIRRLFSKHELAEVISKDRSALDEAANEFPRILGQLHEVLERNPDSVQHKRVILAGLRLKRKELVEQKRQTAYSIREARTEARQKTAQVGTTLLGLFASSKMRRLQRTSIRLQKEDQIAPLEVARSGIEEKVHEVDLEILRVERFI